MDKLKFNKGGLAVYKNKLAKEGLIDTSKRGEIDFKLPRFKEFIALKKEFED